MRQHLTLVAVLFQDLVDLPICRFISNALPSRHAYIDPIAGTTKRTGDPEQDALNAQYLHDDPKENAEHVMLVDLARNDLSRNCHDVKVDFYKEMQYYSHVIHLVSRVSGTLKNEDALPVKAFVDTFPAGTLSGAPKVPPCNSSANWNRKIAALTAVASVSSD